MIVATAGHIDHGKTALVRALTGTDADRLPEEKRRGITIDLGFAYLRLPCGETVGFVDVPGHERLVRTMMAGASGVDLALLVVAADDGVMPQTREHLAVLDLLGIRRGIIALTKADRAAPTRLAEVEAEVRGILGSTALEDAPIVPCSSVTGDGIPQLAQRLNDAALATRARSAAGRFRLAVDRSFTLAGVGLVVTGTVHAGRVNEGDRLMLSPAGVELRVRGLHTQNAAAAWGQAGQRVALNVAGTRLDREAIKRGDWIVAPELHRPTDRLDVRLRLLDAEDHALKHWSAVHLHLGAATVTARVALLEHGPLLPGGDTLAQLVLDAPIGALWGDRFAIRDASAQRTIGGGRVLDPFAPQRRGRTLERGTILAALGHDDHAKAFQALLQATPTGVDLDLFSLARNLGSTDADALPGLCAVVETAPRRRAAFAPERWQAIKHALLDALRQHHEEHPDTWGSTAEELAKTCPAPLRPVVPPAIRALLDAGNLQRTGQLLQLPGREIRLTAADQALWDTMRVVLGEAALDPLRVSRLADRLSLDEAAVRPLLDRLGRIGWLCRASPAYYILPETVARLAAHVQRIAAESAAGLLTVGRFREATGISRHATMPVLEHFDRIGLTRRLPEGRAVVEQWPPFEP